MKATVSGKTLTINGRELTFEQEIYQSVELPDRVIVLLHPGDFAKDDPLKGCNIIALDEDGEMLWRIQDRGVTLTTKDGKEISESYTGLGLAKDEKTVRVSTPFGFLYELDPETGQISNPKFTK